MPYNFCFFWHLHHNTEEKNQLQLLFHHNFNEFFFKVLHLKINFVSVVSPKISRYVKMVDWIMEDGWLKCLAFNIKLLVLNLVLKLYNTLKPRSETGYKRRLQSLLLKYVSTMILTFFNFDIKNWLEIMRIMAIILFCYHIYTYTHIPHSLFLTQ